LPAVLIFAPSQYPRCLNYKNTLDWIVKIRIWGIELCLCCGSNCPQKKET
jgi:hypothetical protein